MSARSSGADSERGGGFRPIAIVGIGCRFADARGPAQFWEIVRSGRNTVREVPAHRIALGYDIEHFYDPRPGIPGKIASRLGGFIEHPELFDPGAFGLTPRDAVGMEPQQRLMVEVTWDALEDAGIVPEGLQGERVAVMLGFMAEDYSRQRTACLGEEPVFRGYDVFTAGGISHAVLSGRISHLLGVTGPSLTLDTACSSSLYATHLACQSLQSGESRMAIAGGVNVFLTPEGHIALSRSGMMSPDGKCKAFDAGANGFVRAEGAGVVVLRPLEDALAEGNPVYAVIRGTGVSSDGRDGGHMMAPGRGGQAQAMRDAYARAGIDPADVHYVETHGTGTVIGDPVEIAALADVMAPGRPRERPLRVASVKGNLGHAEPASGVAGLIKTALAMRHRLLPAQLHYETPNPAIPWNDIPIRVQDETTPWPYPGRALAGVNSFGISGTNAHVVLEGAPEPAPCSTPPAQPVRPSLLPFSAHDVQTLEALLGAHRDALREDAGVSLGDLAYTLGQRRAHRAQRAVVVAASPAELADELDALLAGTPSGAVHSGRVTPGARPELVMVFPGQGSQWLGMGRELLAREPVFGEAIDRIGAAYARSVDWSLRRVLDGSAGLDWRRRLDVLQPLLVAVEVALAQLWASWGVRPDRVIGQSMGEIAAAHVAGALDLDAMAHLACARGLVVAGASGVGAMGVVGQAADALAPALAAWDGRVEIAGRNSPTTSIVAGDRDAVEGLLSELDARGEFARRLEVEFASHCFHMDPLLETFAARVAGLTARDGSVPILSTVDGAQKAGRELDADYWVRNLRSPVAFDVAATAAIDAGADVFLEVSPHATLARAIEEIARDRGRSVTCQGTLQREQNEQRSMLGSLASLYASGVEVDFAALSPAGRCVPVPLTPYQRRRYWFGERDRSHTFRPVHPLLGERRDSAVDPGQSFWDVLLDGDAASYLADYRVAGRAAVPPGVYLELALAAGAQLWPGAGVALAEVRLREALALPEDGRVSLQVVLRRDTESGGSFRILSRNAPAEPWRLRADGRLAPNSQAAPSETLPAASPGESTAGTALFERIERDGLALGPRLRALREFVPLPVRDGRPASLEAQLMLSRASEVEWHAYHAHPAFFEAALQLLSELGARPTALRCVGVERLRVQAPLGSVCRVRVTRSHHVRDTEAVTGDADFFDAEGGLVARLEGLRAVALDAPGAAGTRAVPDLYRVEWTPVARAAPPAARVVRRWILVSDSAAEAHNLAVELEKRGDRWLNCESPEELPSCAAALRRETADAWGLVLLRWADDAALPAAAHDDERQFRIGSWADAIRHGAADAAQVWIATRGIVGPERPVQAGGVLATELEAFASVRELNHCRFFDASAKVAQSERVRLLELMGSATEDLQFVARGDALNVARLRPLPAAPAAVRPAAAAERNFRALHTGAEGARCVALREAAPVELGPDELDVEVHASALCQLDVLASLGLARGGDGRGAGIGRDLAGIVKARGAAVTGFSVGDAVMGLAEEATVRRAVVPAAAARAVPAGVSLEDAAALPLAFCVARLALDELARVRVGERVLLTSASGGVGQAALQLARIRGADVAATSGDRRRREALRARRYEVLDTPPRTHAFDVVVGAFDAASAREAVGWLRPGGRLVDLSPREAFELGGLGALDLVGNRSYCALDFAAFAAARPDAVEASLDELERLLADGALATLPTTVFPIRAAARGLRYLAQNRALGRVVLDFANASETPIDATAGDGSPERAAVLVTGSEPALQDELAARLAAGGASGSRAVSAEGLAAALARDGDLPRAVVHVGRADDTLDPALADTLVASTAPTLVMVSLRDGEAGDRGWEARNWLDQLRVSARRGSTAACVAHDADAGALQLLVERALACGEVGEAWVAIDAAEIAARAAVAPSALLADLPRSQGGATRDGAGGEALRSLGAAARRHALLTLVGDGLAGVLGLGERDRANLDLDRKLSDLGLDSLMFVELFVGLSRELALDIAREGIPPDPSARDVAAALLAQLEPAAEAAP